MTLRQYNETQLVERGTHSESYWADLMMARIEVQHKFYKWDAKLAPKELLGYTSLADMTQDQMDTIFALDGPHGYSIYRALLAKKDVSS